jgi:anti-sigma factor RsiW
MKAEMVCVDGVTFLIDYMEDMLAPDTRRAIDAHLARCPRCVAFVKSYAETPRIFRDATRTVLPAGLGERMRRFLQDKLRDASDGDD